MLLVQLCDIFLTQLFKPAATIIQGLQDFHEHGQRVAKGTWALQFSVGPAEELYRVPHHNVTVVRLILHVCLWISGDLT